ncbi:Tetratricopeptide repeat-containing protein [Spironucleus salmonicida]|uniref:Outer dynein arm-docking complex subunit 4 n=1 Tax=Spironucleus salmonicida TaxID=348837 RepID=V6LLA9_9EUKA|nr:Tetratricopeptide repeat-containing protein [Spironucleus salmonicida]|eukprot:EST44521.1 Tetratricopeptide repeat-containing protein [Spironucleus salmonicida]
MIPKELADQYYTQAQNHYRLGDNEKAIKQVTQAIELFPSQSYFIFRSKCHTTAAHVKQSLEDAYHAIKLNKLQAEAYYVCAEANFYAGEFELALVEFYTAVAMRNHDKRDQKGLSKSIEGIKNAFNISEQKVNKYIDFLDKGIIVEESLGSKNTCEFKFAQYASHDINPLDQFYEAELITATEYAPIDQHLSESEDPEDIIQNYCHVTDDRLFLQDINMTIIKNAVDNGVNYIQNREIFWKNQSKTTIKKIQQKEKKIKSKIDTGKPSSPSKEIILQHQERQNQIKTNVNRKIQKIPATSALQAVIQNKVLIMLSKVKYYENLKDYEKAEIILTSILLLSQNNNYLYKLCKLQYKQNKNSESLTNLNKLIQNLICAEFIDKNKAYLLIDSLCIKSQIMQQYNQFQESQQDLKEAERIALTFKDTTAIKYINMQYKLLNKAISTQQKTQYRESINVTQLNSTQQQISDELPLNLSDIENSENTC